MTAERRIFPVERRKHRRYPIALKLQYKAHPAPDGTGEVTDISSSGLYFRSEYILRVGRPINIILPWPFLLEGRCRLQLRIRGRIVRSDAKGTAVMIYHHEFHTAGRSQADAPRVMAAAD
ncbi:MAG: PilZ domain-containing protein [Acidobacteriia bacterium]|nr:PilZ domain-containing protein [Terriglobia bacterium]